MYFNLDLIILAVFSIWYQNISEAFLELIGFRVFFEIDFGVIIFMNKERILVHSKFTSKLIISVNIRLFCIFTPMLANFLMVF